MNADSPLTWFEANQRDLTQELARLLVLLESAANGAPAQPGTAGEAQARDPGRTDGPFSLERLTTVFGLSPFERDVLLLCAGMELDSRFSKLLAPLPAPTFGLALALLPGAHWSALTPAAPLRYWRLVEVGSGPALTQSPLRIDERILHYLAGASHLDDRLIGYVEPLALAHSVVPSIRSAAEQIVRSWSNAPEDKPFPLVQLYGVDAAARQQVAAAAGGGLGWGICFLRADLLPAGAAEVEALMHIWEREALLGNQVLLLECDESDGSHATRWMERAHFPLILSGRERIPINGRPVLSLEIGKPTAAEQSELWRIALGPAAEKLDGRMDAVVAHFDLGAREIETISAAVLRAGPDAGTELEDAIWQACRAQSNPRLGELAQRIDPKAAWEDLVLPGEQMRTLREIAVHVRRRMKVYEAWGFAAKSTRGLGISALFTGVSGTGKTMAAEVLASELRLDLYRIDLSQVVSKYIGETEKNLRRVFDAAEEGGAILLFDEADALFGKRSEVKDSHDRYANVEISYLLQRMEAYRGLAILTTNMKEAIDTAFLRRIRFVVRFPFPDGAERAEIWRRIFPRQTPVEGLDIERLARMSIAGGNIRNIALYAAFLAADSGEPVRMSHLMRAARAEYGKLEKPMAESEIGGW